LYVAGAAVYPTAGCAHPTLTLVAVSLRLSDHLKQVLT
jgi:choline dehydrogenase-like flavoprotein